MKGGEPTLPVGLQNMLIPSPCRIEKWWEAFDPHILSIQSVTGETADFKKAKNSVLICIWSTYIHGRNL